MRRLTRYEAPVLAAVLRLYERDGRVTINSLGLELDLSGSTVHKHVSSLRGLGLVAMLPGSAGTIRPASRPVTWVPLLRTEAR